MATHTDIVPTPRGFHVYRNGKFLYTDGSWREELNGDDGYFETQKAAVTALEQLGIFTEWSLSDTVAGQKRGFVAWLRSMLKSFVNKVTEDGV